MKRSPENPVRFNPLTVNDGCSRFSLECRALLSTKHEATKPVFAKLFREYGLPEVIRTDNGVPFATQAIARLSRLQVWWIRLGIRSELIEPSSPQQNGRHERLHRTLKQETTRPPAANLRGQQRKFDRFRTEYNNERPHEALDNESPSTRYTASDHHYPSQRPQVEYPGHFEVRRVSKTGGIRFKCNRSKGANQPRLSISHVLTGEYVGMEEVDDGVWNLYFGPLPLGRFCQREPKLCGAHPGNRPSTHDAGLPVTYPPGRSGFLEINATIAFFILTIHTARSRT